MEIENLLIITNFFLVFFEIETLVMGLDQVRCVGE